MPVAFDDLKRKVDLRILIPASVQRSRSRRYDEDLCPFHAETDPSFLIFADGYHCMGCGAKGDVFDYLTQVEHITLAQAVRRVETMPADTVLSLPTEKRVVRPVDQSLGIQFHLALTEEHMAYYREALGFEPYTVVAFQLGYGVLPGQAKVGGQYVDRAPRWTIPVYENNVLVNVKARRDDRCPNCKSWRTKAKKIVVSERPSVQIECSSCNQASPHPDPEARRKYISLADAKKVLFNADLLVEWANTSAEAKGKRVAFLTEGEYKAIAVCQTGLYAVSFPGVNAFVDEWISLFERMDKVIMLVDKDKAGYECANRMVRLINKLKVIALPGDKGDPVDLLRDFGEAPFHKEVSRQLKNMVNSPYYRLLIGDQLDVSRI